ncbi:MAG: hypothetical protein LBV29_05205 [Azoarcus sp.]|nr:hypothetical protein [Azoarcus sp.]
MEYVGCDDDKARAKDRLPLTEENCSVLNMEANHPRRRLTLTAMGARVTS